MLLVVVILNIKHTSCFEFTHKKFYNRECSLLQIQISPDQLQTINDNQSLIFKHIISIRDYYPILLSLNPGWHMWVRFLAFKLANSYKISFKLPFKRMLLVFNIKPFTGLHRPFSRNYTQFPGRGRYFICSN